MADLRRANGRADAWPLTYWSVGNENWGCGGNMRAQYYADEYRRFACFCRNFSGGRLYKVACGFDDAWNEVLMREAGQFMDGLSVHYYTVPGPWDHKGSATEFSAENWFTTLKNALGIEDFIRRTEVVMDRYDPGKRIGMIVDEWGTWYDVEPGTNPGFLYQQNTMRDALVAGVTLNILNAHADRVHMANIAQTINVLQAMALTEGPRMLCTPTYHVFEMYQVHQDATLLPSVLECGECGPEGARVPQLHASASRDAAGKMHLSLCNLDPAHAAELTGELRGASSTSVSGRILTAEAMNAHNTFDAPNAVAPTDFGDFTLAGDGLAMRLPARSVVVLEIT
jgi:alpha-N-arabinofuranosidase